SRQLYSALHEVEPNWASLEVFFDPHRGHAMAGGGARVNGTGPPTAAFPAGGAMPESSRLCFPTSVIQTVVHAGCNTRSPVTWSKPASCNAWVTSAVM